MKQQTFEEFLGDIHYKQNPAILDDDLPDAFDAWMGEIEQDELIRLADLYGMSQFNEGIKRGSDVALEAIKSVQIKENIATILK